MNQNKVNLAINFWKAIRNYAYEIQKKGPISEKRIAETIKLLAETRVEELEKNPDELV